MWLVSLSIFFGGLSHENICYHIVEPHIYITLKLHNNMGVFLQHNFMSSPIVDLFFKQVPMIS